MSRCRATLCVRTDIRNADKDDSVKFLGLRYKGPFLESFRARKANFKSPQLKKKGSY